MRLSSDAIESVRPVQPACLPAWAIDGMVSTNKKLTRTAGREARTHIRQHRIPSKTPFWKGSPHARPNRSFFRFVIVKKER
jgi:hypothetical protein